MIDIDKLDVLPFREAVHTRFKPDSDFNSCIRKKYRTHRISDKEWKIASDVLKHNVGKSIDHAYSNFCYKSIGYNKDFFWERFREHRYWYCSYYDIVDNIIVTGKQTWRNKKRPVKSEYLDPKLVQAKAEKRQQEKRSLRIRKLSQKNKRFNFVHYNDKYKHEIQHLTKLYRKDTIESLEGYKAAIVEFSNGINKPVLLLDYYPDPHLRYNIRESIKLLKLLE